MWADDPPPPPPPPPAPSGISKVSDFVTNPATGLTTTVTKLIVDPVGTPTEGATQFVITDDGYAILVKPVDGTGIIYNNDNPPLAYTIVSQNTTDKTVQLSQATSDGTSSSATLAYQGTYANLQEQFGTAPPPEVVTPPVVEKGAEGVRIVSTGKGGSNGHDGALFVPPGSGGKGNGGPAVEYTNRLTISTNNQIGIETGSNGGKGGNGGSSYLSFWSGKDGGNGGAGGSVSVTNSAGYQVATTGDNKYGIFAYSRSGQAGNGGGGFAAPGGGTGGHSSNGGNVSVHNQGNIITKGAGAFGIYGLSVSNNGGNGGNQWGLVGTSGSGGLGGNGGAIEITNGATGSISTSGNYAHAILAQSIGGSGGSSGTSGNLILSLQGSADNGGNGGVVTVTNNGSIQTSGDYAKGIFAESIGGGGGTGGDSRGFMALGGSGSNGGSGNTVTVTNTGSITSTGIGSDGIFAQSVGGSGGSGKDTFGLLVAVGGRGSKAGNGGAVTVENYGTITTGSALARGIFAQSIGGGGGDGGSTGGMVSVGGSGGGGGKSSTVTVTNGGSIKTIGADANGILAQSVGGGGGNGRSSGSVADFTGVTVGGTAGGGGAGGNVNMTLEGQNINMASLIKTEGDRATGLFAQSVGGGGGTGGGAVMVTGGVFGAASVALGGSGGSGGAGGTVTLSKGIGESNIQTDGVNAAGVMLQSVGGGGGNGGYAVTVAASGGPVSGSLSVGIGGSGGSGGDGGAVTVGDGSLSSTGFNGSILTKGDRSVGFLAQSVGGGGGNGGLAVSAAVGGSLIISGSIGVGVGGSGAGGGAGGTVSVATEGDITTLNEVSTGLLVQSVGGGGGNGGGSITASLAASGGGAGTISIGIGGSAAKAGSGGEVTVATRSGTIITKGENSRGILVQSVGGGGGNGGYSIAAGAAGGGAVAGAVNLGIGGTAGGGGNGGTVRADLQSKVETFNQNATAVLVQSVGGGGGNGGYNVVSGGSAGGIGSGTVSVGLGGSGGSGGVGGKVTATLKGTIATHGSLSNGFVAQSIGGGGGNGGFNVSAAGSGAGSYSGAVSIGLGGGGGTGNNGGEVTATKTDGEITTEGDYSAGVLAQSVGGGGGNGGFNVSAAGSGAGEMSSTVSVGLGGSGGAAGNGSTVSLTVGNKDVWNNVRTSGLNSVGVIAQSIGGGGGYGGFNVTGSVSGAGIGSGSINVGLGGSGGAGGAGGVVNADVFGNIETQLANSGGFLAQSVGGGGGNGGYNVVSGGSAGGIGSGTVSVGLGGSGGSGNIGSSVTAMLKGTIATHGNLSNGFVAQSIGGGGGNGGVNVSAAGSGAGIISGAVSVGLGGSGGTGNNGGEVTATKTDGEITTEGDYSAGVLAQSIGGGGGNGGFNISAAGSGAGKMSSTVSVGLGGSGGAAGNGSTVSLTVGNKDVWNNVRTSGLNSVGVIAQSIGGGGGYGGFNVTGSVSGAGIGSGSINVGLGGSGGSGGDGGVVNADVFGNIETQLANSGGFLVQSVGGGGGYGGYNVASGVSVGGSGSETVSVGLGGSGGSGGVGGKVTAMLKGTIATHGNLSNGFVAQSIGGGGGNGGFNVTTSGSGAGSYSGAVSVGLGGSGGTGNNGGEVTATKTDGEIRTEGDYSAGVLAQSVGGGGGYGGFNVSAAGSGAGTSSGSISVGLGGGGGAAGNGSTLSLTVGNKDVGNNVKTSGLNSVGVIAQSIGGGGGYGGFNVSASGSGSGKYSGTISAGLGGTGSGGGDGGEVTATVFGNIETQLAHSDGVLAQSVGGGGGYGGFSVAGALDITTQPGTAASITASVGGFGGDGGVGQNVNLTRTGDTQTIGDASVGIRAQSIGGGGGNGGLSVAGSIGGPDSKQFLASVGGYGGEASKAGVVTVINTGNISTGSSSIEEQQIAAIGTVMQKGTVVTGRDSNGIEAQSIGGGGGVGGFSFSGIIAPTGENLNLNVGYSMGGYGGSGGTSSNVSVTNVGVIKTIGPEANGIFAQSLGGAGGIGGGAITGLLAGGDSQKGRAVNVAVSVGGKGGDGNTSGDVTVDQSGGIVTEGAGSNGIQAESIGGGGGNGGGANSISLQLATSCTFKKINNLFNITSVAAPKNPSVNVQIDVGGSGGKGNDAGKVTVNNHGYITTTGTAAYGIKAQSIGGGGGNGGQAIVGFSGLFPHADNVDFANTFFVSGLFGTSSIPLGVVKVTVGGSGGASGNGNAVTVTNNGKIQTSGSDAYGIFAHSIGGGGGIGGNASSGLFGLLSLGGSEGAKGNGGDVTVTNIDSETSSADISTIGVGSTAIKAQSVGGGGGNGGVSGGAISVGGSGGAAGNGGSVSVSNFGTLTTGIGSFGGIFAQSVGGGGGHGGCIGFSVISVGGSGGASGNGGTVKVNNQKSGKIETNEENSTAIFAQSVGGGGGDAGCAKDAPIIGISDAVVLVGIGGAGGDGGDVTVVNDGLVQINANNSIGIMAQSVGGGGGTATSALGGIIKVLLGGHKGNGGKVSVTNNGSIIIHGNNSVGIFAQSVGGGGGLVQPGGGVSSLLLLRDGTGNGTNVTINNTAGSTIIVTGNNSRALFTQSVGGGGGVVGLEADSPGQIGAFLYSGTSGGIGFADDITINQSGNLLATGHDSIALTAQSSALDGNGDITVNILKSGSTPSIIDGGSGQGAGVSILNGAHNQLNNYGVILSGEIPDEGITWKSNSDGYAIRGTTGDDHVHNYGWVIGSVGLESGANSFDNASGALFGAGVTVNLGVGNVLSNEGWLLPGLRGRIITTDLTGDFSQSASGVFSADLDLRNQIADRLTVSGSADISGTIVINLIDPIVASGYALPGEHIDPLITTVGNLNYKDITLVVPNTAVTAYSLAYIEDPEIDLNYTLDYAPVGLTKNQHSAGTVINQIQTAQTSPDFRSIATALFFQPNLPALAKIYDSLSGEGVSAFEQSSFYANDLFLKSVAGRAESWILNKRLDSSGESILEKSNDQKKSSAYEWRAWNNVYTGRGNSEGNTAVGSANSSYKGIGFAVGLYKQLTPDALIGIATGYNNFTVAVPERETSGTLDSWHLSGYGAVLHENLYARVTLGYDHFDNREMRHVSIPEAYYDSTDGDHYSMQGFNDNIFTAFESNSMSGDAEVGFNNRFGDFVVTPFAALEFGSLHMNGFTETDAQGNQSQTGLTYSDKTITSLPGRLGMQFTKNTALSSDSALLFSLQTAWVHEFYPDRYIESSFNAAPGFNNIIQGAQPYIDQLLTSIGINVCIQKNMTINGNFECNILKADQNSSGMLGMHVLF